MSAKLVLAYLIVGFGLAALMVGSLLLGSLVMTGESVTAMFLLLVVLTNAAAYCALGFGFKLLNLTRSGAYIFPLPIIVLITVSLFTYTPVSK